MRFIMYLNSSRLTQPSPFLLGCRGTMKSRRGVPVSEGGYEARGEGEGGGGGRGNGKEVVIESEYRGIKPVPDEMYSVKVSWIL